MLLTKKDILKVIKSETQSLREKDNDASKVVHQLEDNKDKYIRYLSEPFELTPDEVTDLENIYANIPDEVVTRKIKGKASDQLHEIMKADLSKLFTIQLDKNTSEIMEDKVHLDAALASLDELSASLNDIVNLPKCRLFKPWKGAELLIMDLDKTSSKEDNPSWVVVKTKYPNQLSYVVSESYKISEHFMNYMSKYDFCERLGKAANKYEGDDHIGLLKCVIESAKEGITQMHQNYVDSLTERVAERNLNKMFG